MEALFIEQLRRCRIFPEGFYSSHISERQIYLTQRFISRRVMVDDGEVIVVINQRVAECIGPQTRKSIFER